jgi:hypothetical protein
MRYEIWYDEDNDLLRVKTFEGLTKEDYGKLIDEIEATLAGKKPHFALGDLSAGHPPGILDKEVRQIFKDRASSLEFDKIAIISASPSIRMISKIVFKVIGRSQSARFFKTEEEALTWLKE